MDERWKTVSVPAGVDAIAPDGSLIRLLAATSRASMVHCTLPAGTITRAMRHRTVDELWYFLGGRGQLWRSNEHESAVVDVDAGLSVSIPVGTSFQFRADETAALEFVIVTIPPWPGDQEAEQVDGPWRPGEA